MVKMSNRASRDYSRSMYKPKTPTKHRYVVVYLDDHIETKWRSCRGGDSLDRSITEIGLDRVLSVMPVCNDLNSKQIDECVQHYLRPLATA